MEKFLSVNESAALFAQSETLAGDALRSIAHALGTAPTFALWGEISADFKAAYIKTRPQADGGDQAWSRFARRLGCEYGLTKPKSEAKAAGDKAEARKAASAAINAAAALPVKTLAEKAAKGDVVAAKALESKAKAAQKAEAGKLKEVRDACVKEFRKGNELALRIGRAAAKGDETALVAMICGEWPALAAKIAAKVAAGKPAKGAAKKD